ncbi:MAG TPA: DNA-processing protein DprA, partial [Acidimicrobiia bacterium]|nr:DNA-processing protein DprA [Acidimicrobiia bacterium]
MTGVNQNSLAVLAMTNRFVDAGVTPLKASEVWRILAKVEEPSRLLGIDETDAAEVTAGTGVEAARLVRLLDTGIGLAVQLEALYEQGITTVTVMDETFPHRLRDRLGTSAPPVLYYAGEVALLGTDGVGVVGSRNVDSDGVELTREVARQVAAAGLSVVSGGARGVDSISMEAAYAAGGTAVGVLADSLERAIRNRDNRRAMLDRQACLCTPYRPDARFSTGTAMGRNKIVYALSRVTLVVASAQ